MLYDQILALLTVLATAFLTGVLAFFILNIIPKTAISFVVATGTVLTAIFSLELYGHVEKEAQVFGPSIIVWLLLQGSFFRWLRGRPMQEWARDQGIIRDRSFSTFRWHLVLVWRAYKESVLWQHFTILLLVPWLGLFIIQLQASALFNPEQLQFILAVYIPIGIFLLIPALLSQHYWYRNYAHMGDYRSVLGPAEPIDWYAWSEKQQTRAREKNKTISSHHFSE